MYSHTLMYSFSACAAPGADSSVWKEAKGAEEPDHRGRPAETSSGHEVGQRVQTEH